MKIGTLSVLFGAHQFLIHPLVVAMAWRRLYRRLPELHQLVAIVFHDIGYWGCADLDGPEGALHPRRGAFWAFAVTRWLFKLSPFKRHRAQAFSRALDAAMLVSTHSRTYCKHPAGLKGKTEPGELFLADKVSLIYDWTYTARVRLTGEWREYVMVNAPEEISRKKDFRTWFRWYKQSVEEKLGRWEES